MGFVCHHFGSEIVLVTWMCDVWLAILMLSGHDAHICVRGGSCDTRSVTSRFVDIYVVMVDMVDQHVQKITQVHATHNFIVCGMRVQADHTGLLVVALTPTSQRSLF